MPESDFQFDLICIGSGPAGQRAAVQAAKLGRRVAVVEKRRVVGGGCLETGTIPSKTFREAVLFFTGLRGSSYLGGPVRVEGRPTAAHLLARVASVVQRECAVVEDQLRRNDVEVILGEASFLDCIACTCGGRAQPGGERRPHRHRRRHAVRRPARRRGRRCLGGHE